MPLLELPNGDIGGPSDAVSYLILRVTRSIRDYVVRMRHSVSIGDRLTLLSVGLLNEMRVFFNKMYTLIYVEYYIGV